MKKFLATLCIALAFAATAVAQKNVPDVNVIDAKGQSVSILKLLPKGKPVVLSFWDTSCKPCLMELSAFSDAYDDWKDEFDFEIVAVSTDDARSSSKAIPLAKGRGWPFVMALDRNGDLKRTMNVQSNPSLYVIDSKGKVVYSHVGYTLGSEQKIHDVIKSLQ